MKPIKRIYSGNLNINTEIEQVLDKCKQVFYQDSPDTLGTAYDKEELISALSEFQKWTKPKDKLPEVGQAVVILFNESGCATDVYKQENKEWYLYHVTYWNINPIK